MPSARHPLPVSTSLGTVPASHHCSSCDADVTRLDMRRGGHVLQFVSCSLCETREWFQNGRPVDLDEVLRTVSEDTSVLVPMDAATPAGNALSGSARDGEQAHGRDRGASLPGRRSSELRRVLETVPSVSANSAAVRSSHDHDENAEDLAVAADGNPHSGSERSHSELVESLTMPISLKDLASVLSRPAA